MGLFFIQDGCFSFIPQSFVLGILVKHFKLFCLRMVFHRNRFELLLGRTPEEKIRAKFNVLFYMVMAYFRNAS